MKTERRKFSAKRRKFSAKFSAKFKAEVALEAIHGVLTVSELAQKYEVHPVKIAQWKKEVLLRASTLFEDKNQRSEKERKQFVYINLFIAALFSFITFFSLWLQAL
jgi:transposase-like protein